MAQKEKSFFEKVEGKIVSVTENYLKDKVKKKLFRLGEVSLFIFLSVVLISLGLAFLIGKYFPILDEGFNFIVLGAIFLIIGYLLNKN